LVILPYKSIIVGVLFSLFYYGNASANNLNNLTAKAWLVADEEGKIINGIHTNEIRSIASITKLMTAMVVIDSNDPLDEVVSRKLYNKPLTRRDLINLAIVKSNNEAAKLLCTTSKMGYENCLNAMNEKARSLNMNNTVFTDSTGLFYTNVSTAEDLIKLVQEASKYPLIVEASGKENVVIAGSKKSNKLIFNNTNTLVGKGYDFIVTKTGFISKSGGCIVFMVNTVQGIRTVILLGSKNTRTRIPEASSLIRLLS
jgi:D-alanyl-D-alanine endopeptidase (penicillin-binding protein 7)